MPGFTPGNPISTLPFKKKQILRGANPVSAAFKLRFSFVSASFQTLEVKKLRRFFCDPKVSAFLKVKVLVEILVLAFQLAKMSPPEVARLMSLPIALKAAPVGGH